MGRSIRRNFLRSLLKTPWSTATSVPQHEYSPITEADGIRLIELQPSQDASAPLRCSLIHKKLSLCGDGDIFGLYIALSYVWGNPEKSKTILVDGKPLGITNNLHSALLNLRDEKRTLMVWADGVCINQRDDAEKAIQIGLMGRIYASAPHTIIYLGPAESTDPESMCSTIREGTYIDKDEKLSSVFMRKWFTRVWVFQEFVFSRNPWLQCGRTRINRNCYQISWG
jgi:hypothetical protein